VPHTRLLSLCTAAPRTSCAALAVRDNNRVCGTLRRSVSGGAGDDGFVRHVVFGVLAVDLAGAGLS